jgi:hypothetical protein
MSQFKLCVCLPPQIHKGINDIYISISLSAQTIRMRISKWTRPTPYRHQEEMTRDQQDDRISVRGLTLAGEDVVWHRVYTDTSPWATVTPMHRPELP